MILRVEFGPCYDAFSLKKFYETPTGTVLQSSSAVNITPEKLKGFVSFWFLDDKHTQHFYGGKVSIHSLQTYPGIIGVSEILQDHKLTLQKLTYNISHEQLVKLLEPFL